MPPPMALLPALASLSSAEAELSLGVTNPRTQVTPGVRLLCYGPYYPPHAARSLHKFLPEVNMSIVHHMILFGGRARVEMGSALRDGSELCFRGHVVYAWARTGQKTPIGLNYRDGHTKGAA